jgi:trk system potassium uptake protein TrkH
VEASPFTDAFFETMSGFTTTGASILTILSPYQRVFYFGEVYAMDWWSGIIVISMALLPVFGFSSVQFLG